MAKKNIGTFLAPNKGFSTAGEFGYAYSGTVSTNDSETVLLEFTTGDYIFRGAFQQMYLDDSADNYMWFVYLNGNLIGVAASGSLTETNRDEIELIFPPRTTVKITAQNIADSTANDMGAIITGRIYDA